MFSLFHGCRPKLKRNTKLRCERLEDRLMFAELGIGVIDSGSIDTNPNDRFIDLDVGKVGDQFTLQVVVEDKTMRPTSMGVIALPLAITWDATFLKLVHPTNQIVTSAFPLQRNALEQPLGDLQVRGAALPDAGLGSAIGATGEETFATLQFEITGVPQSGETPITFELAGAMSFRDASPLDLPVGNGSNTVNVMNTNLQVQTTLRFMAPPDDTPISISGFVFADTNMDGQQATTEMGLPNVQVELRQSASPQTIVQTAITGPDGWYHFEDLDPGTYDIVEVQPANFVDASISPGLVFPSGVAQPDSSLRGTTDGLNAFRNIDLTNRGTAVDFNFGDNVIATKRNFVTSTDAWELSCLRLGLNCVTVRGTSGDDSIDFTPDTDVVRVTVNNGSPQEFRRDTVDIVKIDAAAGVDVVTLNGSSLDDTAHILPNSCSIQTGTYATQGYAVLAVNSEQTTVDGRLGTDRVVLRDSEVDDVLTTTDVPFIGPVTELEMALNLKRLARAVAFERTRAVSVPHPGINDNDVATVSNNLVVDLVGKW